MFVSFTQAEYLWLLLLVPIILLIHFLTLSKAKVEAIKFSNFAALERVSKGVMFSKTYHGRRINRNTILLVLRTLAYILLISSLAGATLHYNAIVNKDNVLIAFDTSASMLADDLQPTRFNVTKQALVNFVDLLPQQAKVGVVSFAGIVTLEQEITRDKDLIKYTLLNQRIKTASGTAIGDSIITSVNALNLDQKNMILLVTDGQNNVGSSLNEAIEYANKNNVRINVLSIGSEEGGNLFNSTITLTVDRSQVKIIANKTQGSFTTLERNDNIQDVQLWFSSILEEKEEEITFSLSWVLLLMGLLFLITELLLLNTVYKTLPR